MYVCMCVCVLKQHTVDSQKIVLSKSCVFIENRFLRFFIFITFLTTNWPQHEVPALIIANFNFASEA